MAEPGVIVVARRAEDVLEGDLVQILLSGVPIGSRDFSRVHRVVESDDGRVRLEVVTADRHLQSYDFWCDDLLPVGVLPR